MKNKKLSRKTRTFLVLLFCAVGMTTLQAQLVHPLYYQAEQKTTGAGINPSALLLMDFENGLSDVSYWTATNTNAGRGEQQSVTLADRENGDPVRFGRYAIKLNWDFTAAVPAQTLGAYFNPSGGTAASPRFQIPAGTGPRIMGFWLYASPECATAQLWVRPQIQAQGATGSAVVAPVGGNMISVPNANSGNGMAEINPPNWTGWKYVYFDWNSATNGSLATQALGPPASASPSFAMFRIMQTSTAANQKPLIKGYFIMDNVRFTSVGEDYTPPTISAITGDGTNLLTNAVVFNQAGSITLKTNYSDGGASGINAESAIFAVNGVLYTHGDPGFSADATSATLTRNFRPGTHSVQAYIEDNFGNITAREVTFKVEDPSFEVANVSLETDEDAFVGREFSMDVVTDKAEDIKELDLNFQWDMLASVATSGAVEFAPGVTGSYTYLDGRLNVKLQNDNTLTTGAKTLATIKVTIDKKVFEEEVFRCNPGTATATYSDDVTEAFNFFSTFEKEIKQDYRFTVVKLITGTPGEVAVTDLANGSPLVGATIHLGNNTGVTGSNGVATGIVIPSGQFDIYAEKDNKYTFTKTTQALTPTLTATPQGIRSGTNIDNATSKTITWMTAPSDFSAKMKIAKEADGESAFVEHTGETRDLNYVITANAAKGNKVTVTGLEPGTTYIYQVGDGTNWSPTRKFTTTYSSDKFSFVALGDHQFTTADQLGMILEAANTISAVEPTPFFFLNVGDNHDTDDNFNMQVQYSSLLDQRPGLANINLTPAYGNHEYMGYSGNGKFMNGHPSPAPSANYNANQVGDGSYYSIYGNIIVLGLDWEHNGIVRQTEQAKWIDEVLTAHSDVTWKFVTLHYPIWPNASTTGSRAALDWVFEKHNVNIVFCGHGHTYRRALVKNSTVISNLGSTANYTDVDSGDGVLHWELGGIRPSDGNSQKWTFAEVDGRKINFTVRDGSNNVTSQSFVLYHQDFEEFKVNFSTVSDGTITATVNNTAIADGADVQKSKDVVFTATPADGYTIKEWKLNGTPVDGNTTDTYVLEDLGAAATVTVEFMLATGTESPFASNLQIYPNPFEDVLYITGVENSTLRVVNIAGMSVHVQKIIAANEIVLLDQLTPGAYFLHIEKDGYTETVKMMKK